MDHLLIAARPKVLAALTRYCRDIDLAEDAYQSACEKALKRWPDDPPRDPEAWLIASGRNILIDHFRSKKRDVTIDEAPEPVANDDTETEAVTGIDDGPYRDDILRLLFVCSEPSIRASDQLILALKIVGGLGVDALADAFLIQPKTMEQRITRAKAKLRAAAVPFETPSLIERGRRLDAVMVMLYLMFNHGYTDPVSSAKRHRSIADEAIRLIRLLLRLFPEQGEVMGLLALCLLQHSRRAARIDQAGAWILLQDQDRACWDAPMIAEGLALVDKALRGGRPGAYQIQAAIAAVHARSTAADQTDWEDIEQLYAALEHYQPTPVVRLNRAVAAAKIHGPKAGLAMIEPLEDQLSAYLYWHMLRGSLFEELGEIPDAINAYRAALGLAARPVDRQQIEKKIEALSDPGRGQRP